MQHTYCPGYYLDIDTTLTEYSSQMCADIQYQDVEYKTVEDKTLRAKDHNRSWNGACNTQFTSERLTTAHTTVSDTCLSAGHPALSTRIPACRKESIYDHTDNLLASF